MDRRPRRHGHHERDPRHEGSGDEIRPPAAHAIRHLAADQAAGEAGHAAEDARRQRHGVWRGVPVRGNRRPQVRRARRADRTHHHGRRQQDHGRTEELAKIFSDFAHFLAQTLAGHGPHVGHEVDRGRTDQHREPESRTGDPAREMRREPDAHAAAETEAAQISSLIPAGCATLLRVRDGVRQQSAERQHHKRSGHLGHEHHRRKQGRRAGIDRNEAQQKQRGRAGAQSNPVPLMERQCQIGDGPPQKSPDVGRQADGHDGGRRRHGKPRAREHERQRDADEAGADAHGQHEKEKHERPRADGRHSDQSFFNKSSSMRYACRKSCSATWRNMM